MSDLPPTIETNHQRKGNQCQEEKQSQ
jgi:hypothetical protein